jgi:hypothetical protein
VSLILEEQLWHVNGPTKREIVAENGETIGMMDTKRLAAVVVAEHNAAVRVGRGNVSRMDQRR